MRIIELERWERSKNDPRKLEYIGQPTAEEVFHELKHRLESTGCLPDEYFLMDSQWENGREISKDADIFCTTDYGGSEGVYLDVYLKWYDNEQKGSITQSFITGKTLGENGNDLDRMFLISSAITKAFHGYNEHRTRLEAALFFICLWQNNRPSSMLSWNSANIRESPWPRPSKSSAA